VVCVELDQLMSKALAVARFHNGKRATVLNASDFLDVSFEPVAEKNKFDRVVMNPPFLKVGKGDQLDHVQHALKMLKRGGELASIMSAGVEFRQDKRYVAFRDWVYSHAGTIERLPSRSFHASGTDVETVVVRVVRG
jgi:16S rRNA G1207 methylase RsmC